MSANDWVSKAEMDMEGVRKHTEQERDRLKHDYPTWPKDDARRWALARFPTSLFVPVLGLCLLRTTLNNVSWWEQYAPGSGGAIFDRGREAFDQHLKGKLILDLVANVEHPFRIILRQLDPLNSASNFQSVYRSLLRQSRPYMTTVPSGWEDTLELLRLMRNTVHNSWIHYPETGVAATVVFKGKTYNFIVGKKLDFVSWDLMVELSRDVVRIVVEVMRDPRVLGLPPIPDPGAGDPLD